MKKFIALFLVATMAFSLYACGNSASTDTKKSGTDVKTSGSVGTDGKNETTTSAPTAASRVVRERIIWCYPTCTIVYCVLKPTAR